MDSTCDFCGKTAELRLGCCWECATDGEAEAARRTVIQHILRGFRNLAKQTGNARFDFAWAWERLTSTGDYAPEGYFAKFGIDTEPRP